MANPKGDAMIPIERTLIDAISLDQEIQLDRGLAEEEMAPIRAAWAAYEPRASWSQPLPMQRLRIEQRWHLTSLQAAYLQHLVFQGEIGLHEAVGLVHGLRFVTALDTLRARHGHTPTSLITDAANLMSELGGFA